ncbi:MAG: hypothetical protein CVU80_02740, partial [Elusimicrobia bacterium HGW-Elusimicrobia-4]
RISLLREALWAFQKSPIIGVGLMNTRTVFTEHLTNAQYMNVHNDYINIVSDMGLVGLGLFLSLVFTVMYADGFRIPDIHQKEVLWTSFATRCMIVSILVYMLFIDTYTSPFF